MSVAAQMGLSDPQRDVLAQARDRWPSWCRQQPGLGVVDDLLDMPDWLRHAPSTAADDVLHTLARLASPTGGDDVTAAGALAWLLLPGACRIAYRLRSLSWRIDELVAAQLWLEVRDFPWERHRKVAANIVMNTRRGVLRDLGVGEPARQSDPTWARTVLLPPSDALWRVVLARLWERADPPAGVDVAEVLSGAVGDGVISAGDVELLIGLAVAADDAGVTRTRRGQGGLCSRRVVRTVATSSGVSASTVKRRAIASLRAVATASAQIPA